MEIRAARGSKKNDRRFKTGKNHGHRPDQKAFRVEQTTLSLEAWRKLSPTQQLQSLDDRLGKGEGAKKQRKRLASLVKG